MRTARALADLPLVDAAFRDGKLSYSKVRALTRAATTENEAELVRLACRTSADGVEQIVRRVKQQACLDDVEALTQSRAVSTRWDDSGALIIQGRLTPEQGAIFLKALAKATEALESQSDDPEEGRNEDTYWARRADALSHIMADSLTGQAASSPGDRHQVVVHVRAETLSDAAALSEPAAQTKNVSAETSDLPTETPLHPETLRRLTCDGSLLSVIEGTNGDPLSVGRKTRAIPPSTRRALIARDRHCQFAGCGQERYIEGHHMVHWAHGGETKLDNLVLLCSRHHRAVHEMGYAIRRGKGGRVEVVKSRRLKRSCTALAEP